MKAFLDSRQRLHNPQHFLVRGKKSTSPEQVSRVNTLKIAAEQAGCHFSNPLDHGLSPLAQIHNMEYLTFLRTIHVRWSQLDGVAPEVIPNVHPDRRDASYPASVVGQAGYHQADTACPIGAHTWEASYWSAQSALSAAAQIESGDTCVYALCRPPGHHAFTDMAGGFCYLNNTAIAAQYLVDSGLRAAILDIDVHHGNGTQGIFYPRNDVLTLSLHADPAHFYPFFWGHAHERGTGIGLGYNVNFPLPLGTMDQAYLETLAQSLDCVFQFSPDVLIIALGLDAHENDPLRGLNISSNGFEKIGAAIATLKLPLLLVQEGGYPSPELGENLQYFLKGLAPEKKQ